MDSLHRYKKNVDAFLADYLSKKQKDFARVSPWGPDATRKILSIVSEGKTIRGSLVLLLHELLKGKAKSEAVRVAAAYELIQTGLLIHDDIMDHDSLRRGKATLHVQYNSEALAMCVGDIVFFMAHGLLDGTRVQKISAQIFQEVGIAQMQDVSFGTQKDIPTKDEIISLYKYKTARYTFSLPMMAGATLAGADKHVLDLLEKLGEYMGILFQIHDDKIGLVGDPAITGKSTGADTRENKKTFARYYPVEQTVAVYRQKALANLRLLEKYVDTSSLVALLTFVTTRKR